ncbi:MAG: inositol monophosphatase [Gammaproteobacteria bacterium RIFCSPHIGHO2_12_FULL_38_11]|nr:MAG: inositol monophosphatase [Gammaproteobacteria bacterium RIFCSPHIGHO2_12_FULL_38_11]
MHPMLPVAINAAREASKTILRALTQVDKIEVASKNSNEFVTQVDRISEEIIIDHIQKAYPDHGILAEESGRISNPKNNHEYYWVIDPLDGTRNFMQGYPQFSITIALMRNNITELGLVFDPFRNDLFTSARGQGAYLNDQRIHVSHAEKMDTALIGTGFPLEKSGNNINNYLNEFKNVFTHCTDVRRDGSSSLDLAYVACGRLDGFWESNLKIWHMAASALMIQEAGGIVSDFNDGDHYLQTGDIVAGNPKMHKALRHLINDFRCGN